MRFGSMCSGIEAASVAWNPLGWRASFVSEIEAFPCAVLKHRHSGVPNLGDMNRFKEWPHADIDVLVAGTPCQSFSVAGLRQGLADPRGNLALVYLAVADRYRPEWLVWENVPGVLSSNEGRDFGAFLGGLGELGYGWAYRVLDAQFFGVSQRRRRVFVVGYLGDWRAAAAVLFEPEGLRGDPAPRREAREDVAGTIDASLGGSDENDARDGRLIAGTLGTRSADYPSGVKPEADFIVPVAFVENAAVRRLTPRECERLQGFPDDYTLIQHRGKPAADGPRYKALGNSMAVPVMAWIGRRIVAVRRFQKTVA